MVLQATEILATRPFSDSEVIGQPQVCGFWGPNTAVLFGHTIDGYNLAYVGLSQVLTDHAAFGPALSSVLLPDQEAIEGPYSGILAATFVAFCAFSDTHAVLVSSNQKWTVDNPFSTWGIKSDVVYYLLTRDSAEDYSPTVTKTTLAGVAYWWPEGAIEDYGDGGPDGWGCSVLVGAIGTETAPKGFVKQMVLPGPTTTADGYATVDWSGSNITVGGTTESVGPFGAQFGTDGRAPQYTAAGWRLIGTVSTDVVAGVEHTGTMGVPQIAGPSIAEGVLAWGSVEDAETIKTVSFHSVPAGGSAYGAPNYGNPLPLPTAVLTSVFQADVAAGATDIAYVPVTFLAGDAERDDVTGSLTGSLQLYGGVVDFRGEPLLRSDWVLLGSWTYGDLPDRPFLSLTAVFDTEIDIAWPPVTGGAGTISYDVYVAGVVFTTTSTGFADTGLAPGTTRSYQVIARDDAGNSGPISDMLTVTTTHPDDPPDTIAPTAPDLFLVSSSTHAAIFGMVPSEDNVGVVDYHLFITGETISSVFVDSGSEIRITSTPNGDGTFTVDWRTIWAGHAVAPYFVLDDLPHFYCLRAYDQAGNESARSPQHVQVTLASVVHPSEPGTPSLVSSTLTTADIAWSTCTGGSGMVYDVYRNGTLHATVSVASFSDTFPSGTHHNYSVQARNSAGWTSTLSLPVSV